MSRLLWVLLALCLVLVACGGDGRSATDRRTDGPLQAPTGSTSWFVVRDGEVFSDGLDILQVGRRIRIDSVSMTGAKDGAPEFLGARLGLPGRPDDFDQRMEGFPPTAVPARFQVEAEGAELEPGETYMLILGFRVAEDGEPQVREGYRIDYTSGGVGYTTEFDAKIVLCPRPMTERECVEEFPAEG